MSASSLALMSSSTGKPCTALTVTESGRGPASLAREHSHTGVVTPDGLVHGDHRERYLADRRFVHGLFQGALGMAGAVHSDDDARHFLLLMQ